MKKLILYSIFNLLNIFVWALIVFHNIKSIYITFMFLTIISFTFSVFYLFIIWVYEVRLHLSKNNPNRSEEILNCKFYKSIRERIFKFVFQLSLTVCIGYWFLCMCGESVMKIPDPMILNLYLHCFIGLQVFIDLFLTHRCHYPELFLTDFLLSFIGIAIYSTILVCISKSYEIYIYPFLELSVIQIIAVNMVLCLISFNVYQLFHYVVERRHKKETVEYSGSLV